MFYPARIVHYLLIAAISLSLTACGGGSSHTSDSQATGSGSVALLFTDGPTDTFDAIHVTITRIELISDVAAPVELFSGDKTINLLDLANHSDLFSYTSNVPAMAYSKIRLFVSNIELVRNDADGNVIETITPKLPGNGKIDLNPQGDLLVTSGQTLSLEMDMDADKSIHITTLGNGGYIFRPVIFIKRLVNALDGKVIRLAGEITNLDLQTQMFRLCRTSIAQQALVSTGDNDPVSMSVDDTNDSKWCPLVHVTDTTVLYGPDGEPLTLGDLEEGTQATVFGRINLNIGNDEKPALDALTVLVGPAGTFTKYEGSVASSVDESTNRFELELATGQGIDTGNPVPVQLQSGTIILSRNGNVLDPSIIETGQTIKVIGSLNLSDAEPDFINAAMVFVDVDGANIKLSGTISAITSTLDGFTLNSDSVGDRCVTLTSNTDIFLISDAGSSLTSEQIGAADLLEGQRADVYGQYNLEGCLAADNILAGAL